jgi:hypothetical protein
MAFLDPERCRVCRFLPAEFCGTLCATCRSRIASFILEAAPAAVAQCWRVSERFASVRTELANRSKKDASESNFPKAATRAAVAAGLHGQGMFDEAVVAAALAINMGVAADRNEFGASAVTVLLRPNLASPDLFERLRAHFEEAG